MADKVDLNPDRKPLQNKQKSKSPRPTPAVEANDKLPDAISGKKPLKKLPDYEDLLRSQKATEIATKITGCSDILENAGVESSMAINLCREAGINYSLQQQQQQKKNSSEILEI